ncbi:MAG: hypothetical protein ACRDJJ_01140 [Actinomycetota bacterium]
MLLLLLSLFPIRYLSVDIAGVDLSAFRILLATLVPVTLARVLLSERYSRAWRAVARTPTMRAVKLFVGWMIIGLILTFVLTDDGQAQMRGIAWVLSLAGTAYVFPAVLLTELLYRRSGLRVLGAASRVWFVLVAAGLVQVGVFLLGLPVNSETIAEREILPVSTILGFEFLRPYSLFGEPRVLGSIMIGLTLLFAFFRGQTKLRIWQLTMLATLGILVSSITFYVYTVLYLGYFFLGRSRQVGTWVGRAVMLAMLVGIGVLLRPVDIEEYAPRLTDLYRGLEAPSGAFGSGALSYAPDLLFAPYIADLSTGNLSLLEAVVGTGPGTFTAVAEEYISKEYGSDALLTYRGGYTGPIGSRVLLFTLLAESGLIGLLLFLFVFWRTFRSVGTIRMLSQGQRNMLKMMVVALFLASAIQVTYVFVLAYIVVLYVQVVDLSRPSSLSRLAEIAPGTHVPA